MSNTTRRNFVTAMSATGLGVWLNGNDGKSEERFGRINPRIKGLSLATYSLRPKMHWWKGEVTSGKLDMFGFLEYCARSGFEAAELTGYFFELPLTRGKINQLKRRAHLLGLDLSGGAIGNDFGHPPSSEHGQQELAYTKKWIDHYADLGVPTIRIFAGRSRPEGASDDQVISNVIANLEQVLPHAEERGVMLGIENHDFATNIDYLEKILLGVESNWLGVTWDTANLAPTATPYEDLSRIARYAITAQLKVTTRLNDQPIQADYAKLIGILQAAKYSGYLVLEYEEAEDAYTQIPHFAADVRRALALAAMP